MLISANLGFLFTDLPLLSAVQAAAEAGFDAVEVHFPYAVPASDLRCALDRAGLPLVSLNTAPGDVTEGEFGLAAVVGREDAARAAVDQAMAYAATAGAQAVHVMAGRAQGDTAGAMFVDVLRYACDNAPAGVTVLIEPLNPKDVPGYFLADIDHAARVLDAVKRANLKILFDCYHIALIHGDVA
ncbi:MAG: TIM barrel protein, partial [Gemmobacter sp.]|nr:TIM barrel protein [Gemmobacter sp.]